MQKIFKQQILIVIILISFLISLDFFWKWTRTQYIPTFAVKLVEQHIADEIAELKKTEKIYDNDPSYSYLERLSDCKTPVGYTPYQTNGNRLRRWLTGRQGEINEITINYFDCSIRFQLRKQPNNEWKVVGDYSHAG